MNSSRIVPVTNNTTENENPATESLALTIADENPPPSPPPPSDPVPKKEEDDQKPAKAIEQAKSSSLKPITYPLTILSFLLSLPILFSVVWLLFMKHYYCEYLLQLPKVQLWVVGALVVLFFVSNAVVYMGPRFPMVGLIVVMVPLIVINTTGLALVGVYKMESAAIPGSPLWLQMNVESDSNWNNIMACIQDKRTCKDLADRTFMVESYDLFSMSKLSPIESGCCIPPSNCDLEYVNVTYWKSRNKAGGEAPDFDCGRWQNDESRLCYSCHACQQGYIAILRGKWLKLGLFMVVITSLLIASHLLLFIATMWDHYG